MGVPYERKISCKALNSGPKDFRTGDLYFMLWYPDQKNQADQSGLFLVPDSLVFVGRNVDGNEDRDTWYFQDTKSYCDYGAYPNNESAALAPGEYRGRVYALREEDLFQIVDCAGLIDAVSQCMTRRRR